MRSQGVHWVHVHPQGEDKFLSVIYRDKLKVHPTQAEVHPQQE